MVRIGSRNVVALALLGAPLSARAATYTVLADGSGHYPTIQAALDAASAGDTVHVGPGEWMEALDLGSTAVTLSSTDGAEDTVIDAGGADAALLLAGSATVSGFTVRNAGGRGAVVVGGSPTFSEVVFEELGASVSSGGAAYVEGASPTFADCTFSGNTAYHGGAIYVASGTVTLTDGEVTSNTAAAYGGAVYVGEGAGLAIVGTTFTSNESSTVETYGHGGALHLAKEATLTAEGATFTGNGSADYATTYLYGGAMYLGTASVTTLTDVTIEESVAYYGGGVFADAYAEVDLVRATVDSNTAYYGSGIWISSGKRLGVTDSAITGNTSIYSGAGLYVYYADEVAFTGSSLSENLSYYGYGAALIAYYTTALSFSDTTIAENTSYSSGGAMWLYDVDAVTFTGASVTDNESTYGDGGAVYAYGVAAVTAAGSTFERNTAYYGGGALWVLGGLALSDSTLTDNAAGRSGGGALVDGYATWAVDVTGVTAEGNTAEGDGGALAVTDATAFTIEASTFVSNESGAAGGALYVADAAARTGRHLRVAGNRARYGGGLYVSGGATPDEWTNVVLQENEAAAGGAACFVETTATSLVSAALLANAASEEGAALYLYGAPADVRNVALAWNVGAAAVHAWDVPGGTSFTYDAWWENAEGDVAGALDLDALGGDHVFADPAFVAYSDNGDPTDDSFVLWRSSALVDAGDPFLRDPDGSASDIGPNSGPYVSLADADGDGTAAPWDCDDADATVFPGAADAWYDGVDQDCGGESDFDQDHDGVDAEAWGGGDCDDTDFARAEPCDTGGDAPPDDTGSMPTPPAGADPSRADDPGCACSGARGAGAGWTGALVALGAVRRRRGRAR